MMGTMLSTLVVAATAVVAAPSFADDDEPTGAFQGEATLEPLAPTAGEQIRFSELSRGCWEDTTDLYWVVFDFDAPELVIDGVVPLDPDAGWEVLVTAPDEPGDYEFFGLCLPGGVERPDPSVHDMFTGFNQPTELLQTWGVDSLLYYDVMVPVGETDSPNPTPTPPPTTPTDPAPHVAPPAVAIPGTPTTTG
jgi:hypothetical protein